MKLACIFLIALATVAYSKPHYGYGPHDYNNGRGHGYHGLFQKVVSHHGNTKFAYNDGSSTRSEHISYDGSRYGSYSVRDADGKVRTVNYKAGIDGFQIVGDDGSVKEDNVARAAELAKAAPKAPGVPDVPDVPDVPEVPEVPTADLPVAPTNAPDYGKRNQEVYENRQKYYGHKNHGYGYNGYPAGKYYGGYGGYGRYGGYYGQYAPQAEKKAEDDSQKHHRYGYAGHGYGPYYGGLFQKVVSHNGNTKFAYNDGSSTREEHIAFDGSRVGSYTVKDADGTMRTVNYKAGIDGFQILGDDGSVKEDNVARAAALAEVAAELAKAAPKAPEVPDVPEVPEVPEIPEVPEADLPVAPTNAPDYGKRNQEVYENRKNYYGNRHHYNGYSGYYGYPAYNQGSYNGRYYW